jgi:hypothetical protein
MSQQQDSTPTLKIGQVEFDFLVSHFSKPASDEEVQRDNLESITVCRVPTLVRQLEAVRKQMADAQDAERLLDLTALSELSKYIRDLGSQRTTRDRDKIHEFLTELRSSSVRRRFEAWSKDHPTPPTEAAASSAEHDLVPDLSGREVNVDDILVAASARTLFEALQRDCANPALTPQLFHHGRPDLCRADQLRIRLTALHEAMKIEVALPDSYYDGAILQEIAALHREVAFSDQHAKRVWRKDVVERLTSIGLKLDAPKAKRELEAMCDQIEVDGDAFNWDELLGMPTTESPSAPDR